MTYSAGDEAWSAYELSQMAHSLESRKPKPAKKPKQPKAPEGPKVRVEWGGWSPEAQRYLDNPDETE